MHTLESTARLHRLLEDSEMKGSGALLAWAGCAAGKCSQRKLLNAPFAPAPSTHTSVRLAPLCLRADRVTTAASDIMADVFQGACCPPLGIPGCAYHLLQAGPIRSQSRAGAVKKKKIAGVNERKLQVRLCWLEQRVD